MNGFNGNGIDHEDRLRGLKVLACLQRADYAKRLDKADEKVTEEEKAVLRVALGLDGGVPQRVDKYVEVFEKLKAQGFDRRKFDDGAFLMQASRLHALIEDSFERLTAFVPNEESAGPARHAYKKFFARLYGPFYGIPTREQAEAVVDFGAARRLLSPREVESFNHYGPSVRSSVVPPEADVKLAKWAGKLLEVKAHTMHDESGIDDLVSSRTVMALDAEDPRTVNEYFKGLGFVRNVTAERGFLGYALQATFGYDDVTARRVVGEMIDHNKHAGSEIKESLTSLVKDEEGKIREITSPHLAERAPKMTGILLALSNLPEDRRKYATYVALDAIRNFTRGLPDHCIRIVGAHYEALATHPAMLRSRDTR